jgi:hypothetical protein
MNKSDWFAAMLLGVAMIAVALITAISLYKKIDLTGLAIAATIAVGAVIILLSRVEGKLRCSSKAYTSRLAQSSVASVSYSDAQRFAIVMGVVSYAMALVGLISGDLPRDGRWGWLVRFFYTWLGNAGPSVLFAVLGTALLYFGTMRRLKASDGR